MSQHHWVNDEDYEDFEQEKKIKEWLSNSSSENAGSSFDFKHLTRNGTARNTLIRAAFSLDQNITDDSTGTLADFVTGSDGRDLYDGDATSSIEFIDAHFNGLGITGELKTWVIKTLKSWATTNTSHSEKFLIDSEW